MMWSEDDLIREFAVGDNWRIGQLQRSERSEIIRRAIYRQKLSHEPFRDSGQTYAEFYQGIYGTNLDTRRVVRPEPAITDNTENE